MQQNSNIANNYRRNNSGRITSYILQSPPSKSKKNPNRSTKRNNDDAVPVNYSKVHSSNHTIAKSPNQEQYHNVDLNEKIYELSEEIQSLKEKLADVNLNNIHLKNLLREKEPKLKGTKEFILKQQVNIESVDNIYTSERKQKSDNDNVNTFSFNIKQRSSHSNDIEEVINKKDKEIQSLQDKSIQLESLVITLEEKLDKSNILLPNIIKRANEYQELYDKVKKDYDSIRKEREEIAKKKKEEIETLHKENEEIKGLNNKLKDEVEENKKIIEQLRNQKEKENNKKEIE